MSTSTQIQNLIKRFEQQIDTYQQSDYNETQTRIEFINPLFIALGWDVNNEKSSGNVVHEDRIKNGRATKMPDYSFRVGGKRKFFVEAKKPSINLKTDPQPAYQLRRYGWNAKLSLSIVTNFAEFAVYDCRLKPDKDDDPSIGRVLYLKYTDYLESWDELLEKFSFDAVWQGQFDQYAAKTAITKGAIEVDAAFLAEMESWREKLAHHLFSKNPSLTQRQLNFSVQQIIDRIVFLRICEDRGIEDYGQLLTLLNGTKVYQRLFRLFRLADTRYNSGLFHFQTETGRNEPDTLTPLLSVDDDILKDILKTLYYPDSPYEFSVLPADILGQVYEQFLGKVIRLNKTHQAIIEEKPEVKKAGGVYYTPTYIVDYIVKQTVGILLKDKKVGLHSRVNQLKILDPACGSGSFLLGAYQFLLDWHLEQYLQNPKKWTTGKNPRLYQAIGKTWKLTVSERKRILLNNIYGVDIDSQAVEVTKLSLLLKVLEDEQSVISQLSLLKERVLPDIDNNIKCGNSLVSPDFYQGQQLDFENEETLYRINAFDWKTEFADVMKAGGFNAVIGNPPYGALLFSSEINYLRNQYLTAEYQVDTYPLFIEKAYQLSQRNSYLGMIVPSAWVASQYNQALRQFIVYQTTIKNVVISPKNTFIDATVETLILILARNKAIDTKFLVERWDQDKKFSYELDQNEIKKQPNYVFAVYSKPTVRKLVEKMRHNGMPLSEYVKMVWGVKIYQKGKGKPQQQNDESKKKIFHSSIKTKKTHKPLLGGKEIRKYAVQWQGMYVDYGEWLAEPRTPEWFDGTRILVREVTNKGVIQATIVDSEFVFSNSVDGIKLKNDKYKLHFILGIINSKLLSFYHLNTSANAFKDTFPKVLIKDLLNFPVCPIDFDNPTDKANHDKMVQFVEQMLKFNQKLVAALDSHSKTVLKRQIEATDQQIDSLVYHLYGLTTEEIDLL